MPRGTPDSSPLATAHDTHTTDATQQLDRTLMREYFIQVGQLQAAEKRKTKASG
jgi:hypothetical protein